MRRAPIDPDAGVRPRDRQWDVTLAVAAGGVLGAEARYGLSLWWAQPAAGFPWSTLTANVVGCFCLGALMSLLGRLTSPHRLLRPFLGIGVLGGFTTFSTFAVDTQRLIQQQEGLLAGLYVLVTVLAAGLATAAGTIVPRAAARYAEDRRRRTETTRTRRPQAAATSRGRR